jgi:serine/threonine protein phosphatase PrpC
VLTSRVATLQDNSAHGEDGYLVRALSEHTLLDAVMDGVTRRGGAQATRLLVDALAAATLTSAQDLVAVLEQVNHQLYQIGAGRFLLTTISAALCLDGKLSVVGVGDSRVFLIRSDTFRQFYSPMRGVFLGARAQLPELYRAEVTIEPGDRLLLVTDGVTDNIPSGELADVVLSATSPQEAAEQINTIMAIRSAGGPLSTPLQGGFRYDDWTAILRFFSAAGHEGPPKDLGRTDAKAG